MLLQEATQQDVQQTKMQVNRDIVQMAQKEREDVLVVKELHKLF